MKVMTMTGTHDAFHIMTYLDGEADGFLDWCIFENSGRLVNLSIGAPIGPMELGWNRTAKSILLEV